MRRYEEGGEGFHLASSASGKSLRQPLGNSRFTRAGILATRRLLQTSWIDGRWRRHQYESENLPWLLLYLP